ncbi:hypothetical protein ACIOG4_27930 [Streptomyces microflavus]|uniref:hypothetical protein n=1 Tax=Streptomyces microflavus TaxID=1919 RepID=UPI00381CB5C2
MPDHDHDAPADDTTAGTKSGTTDEPPQKPTTPDQWRQLLRDDKLPEQLAELPFFRRRRARRAWRSARRDARSQWVKQQRRNVPTPITVPLLALLVAALIGTVSWLSREENHDTARPKPTASPTAAPAPPPTEHPEPAATPSSTAPRPKAPDDVAKAFMTGYSTRTPLQDGTHRAAVQRAAPYASAALVANLRNHDDLDWNQLIASQATSAAPKNVSVAAPSAKDRPAPDTTLRLYREATARIEVQATEDYAYTRRLTLEIARADVGQPWMVTRVLGVEE